MQLLLLTPVIDGAQSVRRQTLKQGLVRVGNDYMWSLSTFFRSFTDLRPANALRAALLQYAPQFVHWNSHCLRPVYVRQKVGQGHF